MSLTLNRVERGLYLDSVALMRASLKLEALPGVEAASLMIGTPANKALLRGAGLLAAEGDRAGANDLIIGVRARDERTGADVLKFATNLISERERPPAEGGAAPRARSLAGALELLPGANLALVSVPGEFAAREARRALERGLHALVFSDNVPLEEERALKLLARDKGLLVMGPDCGTALIAGVAIAFANAVPRGAIGIVSASGTGLQEVSSLIARAGGGVSHGIGVGGRDLDARVGALSTLAALEALERDPATRTIVLISKPPAAEVAAWVLRRVEKGRKHYIICFLGLRDPKMPKNAKFARTLQEAAELALGRKFEFKGPKNLPRRRGTIRGLYCGGTLCAEAELIFRGRGLAVGPGANHFLDLGADEYTRGRPHPMLEPELRNPHVRAALADPKVAAVLLDVVIGYGAHEDPAGVLVGALGQTRKPVIASVTGTEGDPQGYSRQVATLRAAGVIVAPSNAQAAALAAGLSRLGRRRAPARRSSPASARRRTRR